jgi:Na+-transporting methylmalonyl-CoA/oxaloacetate decarboxylase beta subunit
LKFQYTGIRAVIGAAGGAQDPAARISAEVNGVSISPREVLLDAMAAADAGTVGVAVTNVTVMPNADAAGGQAFRDGRS